MISASREDKPKNSASNHSTSCSRLRARTYCASSSAPRGAPDLSSSSSEAIVMDSVAVSRFRQKSPTRAGAWEASDHSDYRNVSLALHCSTVRSGGVYPTVSSASVPPGDAAWI